MNTLLLAKFSNLEISRLALIARLTKYTPPMLETSPAPGKWSVSQVFYHLNTAESFSIIYVSKKRLDINNLVKTGFTEQLKLNFLKFIFILPFKIKAPAVLGDMPEKVDYKSITIQWDATRIKMKELLESLPDEMLYKNVFKQPAIGRINIFQMLDFMQAHFDRHQHQVDRIITNAPTP